VGTLKSMGGQGEWAFVLVSLLPVAIAGAFAVIYPHARSLAGEQSSAYETLVTLTAASTTLALGPTFLVVTIATVLLLHRRLLPLADNVPQGRILEKTPLLRKVAMVSCWS
jgi:hypothetical protein